MDRVRLEAERGLGGGLADDGARRSLDEVLPVEALGGPGVAEAGCECTH